MVRGLKFLLLMAGWLLAAGAAMAAWPERSITLVVGWAPGSGTDLLARQLAAGLEKELGTRVSVLNMEGGDGIFAHTMVAYGESDGYTIGLATPDFIGAYWQVQTEYSYESYTPIVMVEQSPAVFWVVQDSPWRTLKDALSAIRKAPVGTYAMSGVAVGGAYHVAMASLLKSQGIPLNALRVLPSEGAAKGLQDLLGGQSAVCPDSLRDGSLLYRQGKIVPLGVFTNNRMVGFGDVPTIQQATGKSVTGGPWRALLAPPNLPPAIAQRLQDASTKVVNSPEFRSFQAFYGFGAPDQLVGDDLRQFMAEEHQHWGDILREMNLRQRK